MPTLRRSFDWISDNWRRYLSRAALRPDASRPREYLERFTLDSLLMVGSLARGGQDWTLIKDPDGGIHRVQVGHFLGRDHGRIAEMGATYVAVIEIVPDGTETVG